MQVFKKVSFLRTFYFILFSIINIFYFFCQIQVRIDSDGIDEVKDEYDNEIIHDKGKINLKMNQK